MTKRQLGQLLIMLQDVRQDQRLILEKQDAILADLIEIKAKQQWMEEEMNAETQLVEGLGMKQIFLN